MDKLLRRYWRLALLGVLIASAYPLYMGARVGVEMMMNGTVAEAHYPQYLIPYTPMGLSLLVVTGLMPVLMRGRRALIKASLVAVGVFFAAEMLLEKCVTVTGSGVFAVEAWQLAMCAVPRWTLDASEVRTPLEMLIGSYNPAFKLHFYMIALVLIAAIVNCLYGFARWPQSSPRQRRALILQAGCVAIFLGLCILACFTAFWRGPYLRVSPLSSGLMAAFFLVLGVTVGVYIACVSGAGRLLAAALASVGTAAMYAGEMILLRGEVYRFGEGLFFQGIPYLTLAPVDIAIILAAGGLAALVLRIARADRD